MGRISFSKTGVLSAPVADEARRVRLAAIAEMAWRIHARFAECLPPRVSERLGDDLGGKGGDSEGCVKLEQGFHLLRNQLWCSVR